MGGRDNPISIRSKRKITDSLLSLMHEYPFSKISIKDIVERAGLTRQTFYHNFVSKEDVLFQREQELFEEFLRKAEENHITDFNGIIYFYFRYWQRNIDFVRVLIDNNLVYIMEAQKPRYYEKIRDALLRKLKLSEMEMEFCYAFCSGGITNLLVSWVRGGMTVSAQEMAELTVGMVDGRMFHTALAGQLDLSKVNHNTAENEMES